MQCRNFCQATSMKSGWETNSTTKVHLN